MYLPLAGQSDIISVVEELRPNRIPLANGAGRRFQGHHRPGDNVGGMSPAAERPCPCGSGVSYPGCCEPLHDNRVLAATSEQLMRSRYSAYAVGRLDHVFRTWHPRTRPAQVEPTPGLVWTGLTIRDTAAGQPGDKEGVVEFEAGYRTADGPGVLCERSRFTRRAGRWVYLDGDVAQAPS